MTIPIICLIVKNNKKLGTIICASLAGASAIITIIVIYHYKMKWLNYDNKTMYKYYYAKSYCRGVVYYLGCLMSYMIMKGPPRKPKEADPNDALLSPEEKQIKEEKEKAEAERRKKKKIAAAKKMGMMVLALGLVLSIGVTCLLHFVF
jgi:hypothetical protein